MTEEPPKELPKEPPKEPQFIILHKVRGEPAFDIAERTVIGMDTDAWIIPTSGHRAYPVHWWPLDDFIQTRAYDRVFEPLRQWPDHYTAMRALQRNDVSLMRAKRKLSQPNRDLAALGLTLSNAKEVARKLAERIQNDDATKEST